MRKVKIILLMSITVFFLFNCEPAPEVSEVNWAGFWYDQTNPAVRGSFTAELTMTEHEFSSDVRGTMNFPGNSAGNLNITGTVSEEIGGSNFYAELDAVDSSGNWIITGLELGSNELTYDSLFSGVIKTQGSEDGYNFYPVAAPYNVPPAVDSVLMAIDLFSVETIAVTDTGDVWAYGVELEGNTPAVYLLAADGTIAASYTNLSKAGPAMCWGDNKLWFVTEYEETPANYVTGLVSYDIDGGMSETVINLSYIAAWDLTPHAITYSSSGIWTVNGMVTMAVNLINSTTGAVSTSLTGDFFDVQSIALKDFGFITYQWSRISYPDFLILRSATGAVLKQYVAPVNNVTFITSDSNWLYLLTSNKQVLKMALTGFIQ